MTTKNDVDGLMEDYKKITMMTMLLPLSLHCQLDALSPANTPARAYVRSQARPSALPAPINPLAYSPRSPDPPPRHPARSPPPPSSFARPLVLARTWARPIHALPPVSSANDDRSNRNLISSGFTTQSVRQPHLRGPLSLPLSFQSACSSVRHSAC